MRYMKKGLQALVGAVILFAWTGCDNFLEPDPASFSTTANFYTRPEHFEQGIVGVYSEFRSLAGDDNYRWLIDGRGPNATKHFDPNLPGTVGGTPQVDEWTMTVDNGQNNGTWDNIYDLVKEANNILDRIDAVEFPNASAKDRIIGEAKFMRSFAYWLAPQFYGDVPLILSAPTTPDEAFYDGGRTPVATVYSQVITDLTDAISKLPVTPGQPGRVTEGAARFLRGRTYLLTAEYQNALADFEALMAAPYSYALHGDYLQNWDPNFKNGVESIVELQYSNTVSGQPDLEGLITDILPWNSPRDVILENSNNPGGDYHPTPDVIRDYETGDARFEASIAWFVAPGNRNFQEIACGATCDTVGDSLAMFGKFLWPLNSSGEPDINWVVFRYADVLLSAAEAAWRLGQNGKAATYVDEVRARADLPPLNADAMYGDGWWIRGWTSPVTGDAMGDAILHERMIEFLGEGHSWLDLKRFGDDVALAVMEAHAEDMKARDPKVQTVYNITEHKLRYPIPQSDVVLANLEQNPGW